MIHGKLISSCCVTIQESGILPSPWFPVFPANISSFRVNNGKTKTMYSDLTIKTPEWSHFPNTFSGHLINSVPTLKLPLSILPIK